MKCDVCGRTDAECRIRSVKEMFLCPRHITQYYRNGEFNDNTIYQPNEYIIHDDFAEIVLKNKKCEIVGYAIIDLDDVELCKKYKWYMRVPKAGDTNYVMTSFDKTGKKEFLHRVILNYFGNLDIDHINRNGLDNRKDNLRIVTHSENISNNKYSGVKKVPSGKWKATICRNYKNIYIGTFNTKEEAIYARKKFIEEYNKEHNRQV